MTPAGSVALISSFLLLLLPEGGVATGELKRTLATEGGGAHAWTYRRTSTNKDMPYGPSDWHLGYPDCGKDAQSPIDLAADVETIVDPSEVPIEFFPSECDSDELFFQANERVWEVKFDKCSETPHLKFDGATYNLLQIHIHSPSEHMIGGSLHDAEIHWVHLKEGTTESLLVVGVLFDTSEYAYNVQIQHLWDVLEIGEETTEESFVTRPYDVLPSNPTFSHYMGSLTTPPCTEGVKWVVMADTVLMGKIQLEDFRQSVAVHDDSKVDEKGNTNRPYQPLNGREVLLIGV